MTQTLAGKTAVVTAAAQGIGRASALALAAAGAKVIATDIAADKLADLAVGGIAVERLDVLNADAISAFASRHGDAVDILFNCAGVVHAGSILECSEADWRFALDLNVTAHVPHDPRVPAGHGASAAQARSSTCRRSPRA